MDRAARLNEEMEDYNSTMMAVANAKGIARSSGDPNARVIVSNMERPGNNTFEVNVKDQRRSIVDGAYKELGA